MAIDEETLLKWLEVSILNVMRAHYKRGGAPTNGSPVVPQNEWPFIHSGNILGRLFNFTGGGHLFTHFDDDAQLALAERALARLQKRGLVYVTDFIEDGSVYDASQKKHFPTKIPRRRYELTSPLYAIARAVSDEAPPVTLAE